MNLIQIVAPTTYAVELATVQGHVRSTEADEASYLSGLIVRAQAAVENRFGIALTEQTWKMALDAFPTDNGGRIYLPRPPLISIESFAYVDEDGAVQSLAVDTGYQLDLEAWPARLYPPLDGAWPAVMAGVPSPVRISFKAGYKSGEGLAVMPPQIPQALLLLIGQWYENREGGAADDFSVVDALLGHLNVQADLAQ